MTFSPFAPLSFAASLLLARFPLTLLCFLLSKGEKISVLGILKKRLYFVLMVVGTCCFSLATFDPCTPFSNTEFSKFAKFNFLKRTLQYIGSIIFSLITIFT
jgi:hypothetical protein